MKKSLKMDLKCQKCQKECKQYKPVKVWYCPNYKERIDKE